MGRGALRQAASEVNRLQCRRVMIVTDKILVAAGLSARLETVLSDAGIP